MAFSPRLTSATRSLLRAGDELPSSSAPARGRRPIGQAPPGQRRSGPGVRTVRRCLPAASLQSCRGKEPTPSTHLNQMQGETVACGGAGHTPTSLRITPAPPLQAAGHAAWHSLRRTRTAALRGREPGRRYFQAEYRLSISPRRDPEDQRAASAARKCRSPPMDP